VPAVEVVVRAAVAQSGGLDDADLAEVAGKLRKLTCIAHKILKRKMAKMAALAGAATKVVMEKRSASNAKAAALQDEVLKAIAPLAEDLAAVLGPLAAAKWIHYFASLAYVVGAEAVREPLLLAVAAVVRRTAKRELELAPEALAAAVCWMAPLLRDPVLDDDGLSLAVDIVRSGVSHLVACGYNEVAHVVDVVHIALAARIDSVEALGVSVENELLALLAVDESESFAAGSGVPATEAVDTELDSVTELLEWLTRRSE